MKKNNDIAIHRSQSGFTLIEVLVALVVLSVGILGLISSVGSVMHYQRHSSAMTRATMHATDKLEEIKRRATNEPTGGAYGFDYLVRQDGTGYTNGWAAPDNFTRSSTDTVDGFNRAFSLTVFPAAAQANESFLIPASIHMVEAVVTTTWTNEKGDLKSVQVATVLHRRQFVGG